MKDSIFERRKHSTEIKMTVLPQGSIKPEGTHEITNRLGNKILRWNISMWEDFLLEDLYLMQMLFL